MRMIIGTRMTTICNTRGVPGSGTNLPCKASVQTKVSHRTSAAATSPFFLGESMENARTAMQCDNPLIQMQAAREGIGIAELACFLGDQSELVRVWPSEPPLLRPVWLLTHQDL